jgi:tRNA (Thr-GGU) A37 N-methylase
MAPIGTVQSCFSTRNGTPRQPLVVTLARATVAFDPGRVPAAALEGLASYSHCWILYVFHLNTDLDKMWKDPARSKLKAKAELDEIFYFLMEGKGTETEREEDGSFGN